MRRVRYGSRALDKFIGMLYDMLVTRGCYQTGLTLIRRRVRDDKSRASTNAVPDIASR